MSFGEKIGNDGREIHRILFNGFGESIGDKGRVLVSVFVMECSHGGANAAQGGGLNIEAKARRRRFGDEALNMGNGMFAAEPKEELAPLLFSYPLKKRAAASLDFDATGSKWRRPCQSSALGFEGCGDFGVDLVSGGESRIKNWIGYCADFFVHNVCLFEVSLMIRHLC